MYMYTHNTNNNRKDKSELVVALDRISDEIKSGERITDKDDEHRSLLVRLMSSFQTLLQSDFWSFRQIVAFLLTYLYREVGHDFVRFLQPGPENILHLLLQNVTNTKREVRDAMAQSLGSMSAVLGDAVFQYVHDFIDDVSKNRNRETYQVMEGLMVMVGYVTCKCPDISLDHWTAMCNLLLDNASNTHFESYSNYVRLQAVKALYRILQSPRTREFMQKHAEEKQVKDTIQKIEKTTFERFQDADINVRRATSVLHNTLFEDKVRCFPNDGANIVKDMIHSLIDHLENVSSWEARHGLCEALFQVANSTVMVSCLETETVSKINQSLKQNIERDETDASAYAANAAAGKALVQLFITLHKTGILSNDELTIMYRDVVQPDILFMLNKGQPSLLDCASASTNSLIAFTPDFIRPHLKNVLYSLYKNKFHASYPIRSTAGVVFLKARNLLGVETDEQFITDLTSGIISTLSVEATHKDYEVRDAIFKAFEDLFLTTQNEEDSTTLEQIFTMLKKAAVDKSGRFSEVPRSSAIRALASYISHLNKNKSVDVSLTNRQIDEALTLASELLQDDESSIVKSTIRVIQSLISSCWEKISDRRVTIAALVFAVGKLQDDELKYSALPVYISLLGSVVRTFETESDSISKLFAGFKDSFTLSDENDEEKREAVSAVLRDISACDLSQQELSTDEWELVLSHVAKGLLLEDNRESPAILANCMLFLCALTNSKSLASAVEESSKNRALLKVISHLFLHLLCNKPASDFDFSEDIDELGEVEEDDLVDTEQLQELSKLDKQQTFSFAFVGRNRIIVDTIANVISVINDKEFCAQYMNNVNLVLREHAAVNSIAPYVPSWVRPLTHLASVRNIEHLLTEDNKIASLRSVANGSSNVDDEAARALYATCIEEGPSVTSDVLKGLYLRVIARVAPLFKPAHLIQDLSQFQCVPDEIDIESDDHLFSVEDIHYGYRFGASIEETSPYYSANACSNAVIAFIASSTASEQNKISLLMSAMESIMEMKDDDEEEVRSTKLMLLYYALLAAKKQADSIAVFGNDDVQDALKRLVDEDLLEVVTKEQDGDSSPLYLWTWRLLEAVGQVLTDVNPDAVAVWGAKIAALIEDDGWVGKLSTQGIIAAFSACGHLLPVPTKSYLQLLSDMIANEDIDEDKFYLPRVLSWLQKKSIASDNPPLTLPDSRGMSIKGNSTFSAKQ